MKRYIVKYEDMKGVVHTENIEGVDYEAAKSQLKHPQAEIYWSEELKLF